MDDFALICRTYGENTKWFLVPKVINLDSHSGSMEIEFEHLPDGTLYYSQYGRMSELFQPERIEILAALRKLIHDVPEESSIVTPAADRLQAISTEYCDNPECCPPANLTNGQPSIFDEWETA